MQPVNNFDVFNSIYGRLIVNRHCDFQVDAIAKTGRTHIESELRNMLSIVNTLPEECVVVDGGANVGLVALPIAQLIKARRGQVIGFEPQRMLFYALAGSIALNDLENIVVHQKGLGNAIGTLRMPKVDYSQRADYGLVSLSDQAAGDLVDIVTLDSLNLDRLDFLKLDVEGAEIAVLEGGQQTIKAHEPWCWIEYWKIGAPKIARLFDPAQYDFFIMDPLNMLCAPKAKVASTGISIQAPKVPLE